ncbi:hypothetical protein GEV02_11665 [Rugamonas sp. FT29W]|uniref:Uncharacterized protein n=1 Tax=Rugamonas aquatica TaxID=2743357 RepID=A0A6A7N199_9BURK|nr:hypothetical protein [Rugamonas aquatica]
MHDYFTRWKSAPFQVGTNFESLSAPLQNGLRFFHPPLPANSSARLAVHLPSPDNLDGEANYRVYHVPGNADAIKCFASSRLGPAYPPVAY